MFSKIVSKFSFNRDGQGQRHISRQPFKQNTNQIYNITTSFIPEFISIAISNLAFWFIPHTSVNYNIQETKQNTNQQTNNTSTYISSISSLSWPEITLIAVNIFTAITFIILYYFEIRREIWLVRHFDYSRRYHSLHLTRYKRDYPEIFTALGIHNHRYFIVYRIAQSILIINIITSISIIITMNVLATNTVDYKTITTMITNFWLAYSKVARGLGIAQESLLGNLGIAYFNSQNLSFNRIDPHFKRHISNSNAGLGTAPPSRIASRRESYQQSCASSGAGASDFSNSTTPPNSLPNSLSNSLAGGLPIQMQLELIEEPGAHDGIPVIYIQDIDFIEEDKNI